VHPLRLINACDGRLSLMAPRVASHYRRAWFVGGQQLYLLVPPVRPYRVLPSGSTRRRLDCRELYDTGGFRNGPGRSSAQKSDAIGAWLCGRSDACCAPLMALLQKLIYTDRQHALLSPLGVRLPRLSSALARYAGHRPLAFHRTNRFRPMKIRQRRLRSLGASSRARGPPRALASSRSTLHFNTLATP